MHENRLWKEGREVEQGLRAQSRPRAGSSKDLQQQASEAVVATLMSPVYRMMTLRISSISNIL